MSDQRSKRHLAKEYDACLPFKSGTRPIAAGRKILVVDDEIDSAETLCALLELLGADVRIATDATAALEAVTTYRPSVVVLDIGLPDIDGHEFARSVRRQADAGITLIALTGWSQEEDMRRSKEAGIDHHLVKPLDMSKLEALLTALQTSPTS